MEAELRSNLLACATAFTAARGIKFSTLGKKIGQDARFFDQLSKEKRGFTVRVYSQSLQWLSDNWPEGTDWPADVTRPAPVEVAA